MLLEEGLAKIGWEVDVVACVGKQTICLESRRVPCVEEAVDGGRRRDRNGGSGGGACHQDDALGCRWEAVPPLCFLVHLALGGDDGTERFVYVQPGRDVCKDVCETHVVLWGWRGWLWQIHVCPLLELDACSLARAKGKWRRDNSRGFYCDGLEEVQDVVAINCDGGQRLGGSHIGGGLLGLTGLLRLGGGRLSGGQLRFPRLLCFSGFRGFNRHDAIVVASLFSLAWGSRVLCPLRDEAGKDLQ